MSTFKTPARPKGLEKVYDIDRVQWDLLNGAFVSHDSGESMFWEELVYKHGPLTDELCFYTGDLLLPEEVFNLPIGSIVSQGSYTAWVRHRNSITSSYGGIYEDKDMILFVKKFASDRFTILRVGTQC